jgi:hypothetical protein
MEGRGHQWDIAAVNIGESRCKDEQEEKDAIDADATIHGTGSKIA